ncbi:MAG: serine hydrolase [Bacteroidales bacterium]|nr:serine hydrolase [Bacteroidales bacterium]
MTFVRLNKNSLRVFLEKIGTYFLVFSFILCACNSRAQQLARVSPESVGMSSKHLKYADEIIEKAISDNEIPGAVLGVVKNGKMAYLKAYGNKQVFPRTEKMDVNTVFDLASVTKPIATATSAMILIERGQLRLFDKVNLFIPNFQGWKTPEGKTIDIRVVDLLTHTSGLPPYASVEMLKKQFGAPNPNGLINYIATCKRDFEPQTDMQYSCLNYIALQRIIETITKQSLKDFAKKNIFDVLGMQHTDFQPKGETLARVAPTEKQKDGTVLRGIVHDPLARVMNGGISGNAGLFSDVNDLAVFATALQNDGEWNGKRILSPLSVKAMCTVPRHVTQFGRTLGWDIFSPYASNSGDLLSPNTYGHTGYTGTSLVMDPDNKLTVILLTNRVHPDDRGGVIRLRALVANAVAGSIMKLDGTAVAKTPAPWSYEDHYKKRMQLFDKEPPVTSKDIIMLGNSLTEGGNWNELFGARNIRNRGIIGDDTKGILGRMHQVTQGKPKKVFLLIGINDIANDVSTDSIVSNISKIVSDIKQKSPKTKIYLQSILPINESFGRYKRLIDKTSVVVDTNRKIERLAKKQKVNYLNIYPLFLEKNSSSLRKDLTSDGLHLNKDGYLIWVKELKKHL